MEWFNVESVDELKKLGKFREIGAKIKKDCNGIVNIKLGSWKNLYNSILSLRQLVLDLQGYKVIVKDNIEVNRGQATNVYFNSLASEYIFYLLELDGKDRLDKLNINRKYYSNKKLAKGWRDKIAWEIHPDRCNIDGADRALAKLNQLYEGMISNGK